MQADIDPPNMWSHKESEASVIERMKVPEDHFKNTITPSIRPIPSSVRFDGSRITVCKAIDSLILEIEAIEQDVKSNFKVEVLLYPKRINHFVSLTIYFETLGNWMLISLVFSVS